MFKRLLIANRGEIAVRIIRCCREMEIEPVAVYSTADREALHVQLASQAVCIGPPKAADSYLNMPNLLEAARATGCDAVHPGFGFLSENSEFARLCTECGLRFVGPPASVIDAMGNKAAARRLMKAHGVPVVPGSRGTGRHGRRGGAPCGAAGLSRAGEGGSGRRRHGACAGRTAPTSCPPLFAPLRRRRCPALATGKCIWKSSSSIPGTLNSRFWRTVTDMWCIWGSGTALSSAKIRS